MHDGYLLRRRRLLGNDLLRSGSLLWGYRLDRYLRRRRRGLLWYDRLRGSLLRNNGLGSPGQRRYWRLMPRLLSGKGYGWTWKSGLLRYDLLRPLNDVLGYDVLGSAVMWRRHLMVVRRTWGHLMGGGSGLGMRLRHVRTVRALLVEDLNHGPCHVCLLRVSAFRKGGLCREGMEVR